MKHLPIDAPETITNNNASPWTSIGAIIGLLELTGFWYMMVAYLFPAIITEKGVWLLIGRISSFFNLLTLLPYFIAGVGILLAFKKNKFGAWIYIAAAAVRIGYDYSQQAQLPILEIATLGVVSILLLMGQLQKT